MHSCSNVIDLRNVDRYPSSNLCLHCLHFIYHLNLWGMLYNHEFFQQL